MKDDLKQIEQKQKQLRQKKKQLMQRRKETVAERQELRHKMAVCKKETINYRNQLRTVINRALVYMREGDETNVKNCIVDIEDLSYHIQETLKLFVWAKEHNDELLK